MATPEMNPERAVKSRYSQRLCGLRFQTENPHSKQSKVGQGFMGRAVVSEHRGGNFEMSGNIWKSNENNDFVHFLPSFIP